MRAKLQRVMRELPQYIKGDRPAGRLSGIVTDWQDYLQVVRQSTKPIGHWGSKCQLSVVEDSGRLVLSAVTQRLILTARVVNPDRRYRNHLL
jgi:hypothetical protein